MGGAVYTQEEIDDALTALIAYAGNASGACRYLESEGKRSPGATHLKAWAQTTHWERYEELRDKFAEKHENTLANNYRDAARFATEVTMLAVEKAKERLEKGKDEDPARSAAALAKVGQGSTDKLLSLTGRPTQITETRDIGPLLRSLAAKGVITLPEEPAEIPEATSEEDADGPGATSSSHAA